MGLTNTETEINITLNEVRKAWLKHPYLRFGQLVVDVLGEDLFYVTDEKTREKFRGFIKKTYEGKIQHMRRNS